jgi:hypothetical protein
MPEQGIRATVISLKWWKPLAAGQSAYAYSTDTAGVTFFTGRAYNYLLELSGFTAGICFS